MAIQVLPLVNRIRRKLKLDKVSTLTDTSGHWTAEDILDMINDRAEMFANETKCLFETSLVSLVDSQRTYDYESDWGEILGILFDNKPLRRWSVQDLDFLAKYRGLTENWRETESSTPSGWYDDETTAKFGIVDTPAADDTDALTVLHTVQVTPLTTATTTTDEPFNGKTNLRPYHMALYYGVVADCLEEDGDSNRASIYERRYKALEMRCKLRVKYPDKFLASMINSRGGGLATSRFWTA